MEDLEKTFESARVQIDRWPDWKHPEPQRRTRVSRYYRWGPISFEFVFVHYKWWWRS